MAKEIPIKTMSIPEKVSATIDHFEQANKCGVMMFVAYPEFDSAGKQKSIQLRIMSGRNMPDEALPNFYQLFTSYLQEVKKKAEEKVGQQTDNENPKTDEQQDSVH